MKIIKSLSLILLVMAVGTTGVYAYDFEKDGIYYNILSEEDRTVEVTNQSDWGDSYSGDIVIPQRVINDGKTYSVTTIGENAFYYCDALTSVSMPSITTISDYAFYYCSALTSVSMQSVTTIGDRAFGDCSALTSISMPSVMTIGEDAFNFCEALTSVEMPAVTTIGDYAFYYCSALTSVSMQSVTTIGDVAFGDCSALTSVSMPSVTTIGDYVFYYCSALTSVSMPEVTTIGGGAFGGCSALTSVHIPASCTSIAGNSFQGCQSLEEIVVDENNPNYSSMDGVLYDKDKTTLIGWPTAEGEIDIMPSVTTIGDGAFYDCDALLSVSMPSVTTIGNWAFGYCSSLTSVEMPKATTIGGYAFGWCYDLTSVTMPAVTTIGDRAFYYCNALTSLDIPASVTTIGKYSFSGCSSLTSVYCHWEQPLECDPRFEETVLANATLYVPDGCVDAYRGVYPWSEFANIEEGGYSGIADATASEVVIKVIDGAIVIEGGDSTASAPVVEVYSAGGVCVYRGTDSSIGGLTHGVYVVKVGDTVHKVAL